LNPAGPGSALGGAARRREARDDDGGRWCIIRAPELDARGFGFGAHGSGRRLRVVVVVVFVFVFVFAAAATRGVVADIMRGVDARGGVGGVVCWRSRRGVLCRPVHGSRLTTPFRETRAREA